MSTQEALAGDLKDQEASPRRVVEAEIRLPKFGDVDLPKVDWEPLKSAAEDLLLTSLGLGVLLVRGVVKVVEAAHRAGAEAVEKPGPVLESVLAAFRREPEAAHKDTGASLRVPVLPIANYEALAAEEIDGLLGTLTADQLQVLHEFEAGHQSRSEVLESIERRLAAK